jgi:NhaA family Na+:H+ antiporter
MIFFLCLATAMVNSPFGGLYHHMVDSTIGVSFNASIMQEAVKDWVKDVLMVFFFLVVAMELKVEMMEGFLSKPGQVRLPLLAALGGVVTPALIYYGLNHDTPAHVAGWAIPSATDIAFALAILVLAGKHVPASAKIFLLAIAIFDDLFAILIIAFFYSDGLATEPLLMAFGGTAVLAFLNARNVNALTPYMLTGVYLWYCLHHAGVHTTIAGVAVGMAIPLRDGDDTDNQQYSPLKHCMHLLHGWVSFLVLPLFAFTASGIDFSGMTTELMLSSVPMGIALGLFFGKQIGIFGTTWLLVKLKLAALPEAMNWRHVYGVSLVGGVGFTMSLFIGLLAFDDPAMQHMVKAGVIGGSMLASVAGFLMFKFLSR